MTIQKKLVALQCLSTNSLTWRNLPWFSTGDIPLRTSPTPGSPCVAFLFKNETLQWNATTQLCTMLLHQSLSKLLTEKYSCLSVWEHSSACKKAPQYIQVSFKQFYSSILKYKHSVKLHSSSAHTGPVLLEVYFLQFLCLSIPFSSPSLFNIWPFPAERDNSRGLAGLKVGGLFKKSTEPSQGTALIHFKINMFLSSPFSCYKWPQF